MVQNLKLSRKSDNLMECNGGRVVLKLSFFAGSFNSVAVFIPEAHHMVQKKNLQCKKSFLGMGGREYKRFFEAIDFLGQRF